jgi:hypothetical protein
MDHRIPIHMKNVHFVREKTNDQLCKRLLYNFSKNVFGVKTMSWDGGHLGFLNDTKKSLERTLLETFMTY